MIRLEVFKQLTKITYTLERMKEDDQIRSIQIIDQDHVQPGEDERTIRLEVFKQLTKITYSLERIIEIG